MSVQGPQGPKLTHRDFQFSLTRLFVAITLSGVLLVCSPPSFVETTGWGVVTLLVLMVLLNDWSLWHVRNADNAIRYGNFERAASLYTKAISARPDDDSRLSWFLSTCPAESIRDGGRALELAQAALTREDAAMPVSEGCVAAAFAEMRQFDEAVKHGKVAVETSPADSTLR